MENQDFNDTLKNVVEDGLVVCLTSYENISTNLYLLLQHLRCLVEDTRDLKEYDDLNSALYSFYSSISAARKYLTEVDKPVRDIAKWIEAHNPDDEDDEGDD